MRDHTPATPKPQPSPTLGGEVVERDLGRIRDAIGDLKAFQETHRLGRLSVREMIEEGRRH